RSVLVINNGKPRASRIPKIRNLIACPEGMSGKQMLELLHHQVEDLNTKVLNAQSTIFKKRGLFFVNAGGNIFRDKKLILASGITDNEPEIEGLDKLCSRKLIAYCPICDGYEFTNYPIGILIKDRIGLKKAHFFSTYSKKLHVFNIGRRKLSPQTQSKLKK